VELWDPDYEGAGPSRERRRVQLHGVVRVSVVRTGRLMYLGGLERGELGRAQWASSGTDAVPSPVRRPSRSRVEKPRREARTGPDQREPPV
jgi:hypothetical protein